jgi:Flp pilus assembly protein TadD
MLGGRKWDKAIASYEKALLVDPRHGPAHLGLGLAALEQNRAQAAIEHFRRAVSVHPTSAMFYYYLGKAYELSGDKDRARSRYRYAVRLDPKNVHVRLALGLPVRGDKSDEKARARAAAMRPTGI